MSAKNIVLNINDWNPHEVKYMAPKVNNMGGKSINIISKQTNRTVHISTPLMMTWGISDFLDEKSGESDGKFSISLQFPNEEYRNSSTDSFLAKLQEFENQILDDAVKNSELWWGERKSLEICKDRFFPFIKYIKNKDTRKIDYSKPPTFRPKVPCYDGKWGLEIYDINTNRIFPCESESSGLPKTPMELVPKLSRVACGLQCSGIWIGGKGWGVTWKMFQCLVKPMEVVTVAGKCHIQLSNDDKKIMDYTTVRNKDCEFCGEHCTCETKGTCELKGACELKQSAVSTEVEDSDTESEPVVEDVVVEAVSDVVVEDEVVEDEVAEPVQLVKKVLKKVVVAPVAVAPVEPEVETPKKKMVIKKKVV